MAEEIIPYQIIPYHTIQKVGFGEYTGVYCSKWQKSPSEPCTIHYQSSAACRYHCPGDPYWPSEGPQPGASHGQRCRHNHPSREHHVSQDLCDCTWGTPISQNVVKCQHIILTGGNTARVPIYGTIIWYV